MRWPNRCFGLVIVLACLPTPGQSQTTYSFQSTPGTHPFSFSNPHYPTFSNPLGNVSVSTPITLHDSAANTDTAATLMIASELSVSTNVSAVLTGGSGYDQPFQGGSNHFWIYDAQSGQQLLNAYYFGHIVGNLGSNTAVFSGPLEVNSTRLSLVASPTFSFTLTSIAPAPEISPTGTLTNFTADFSAQITSIPESGMIFLPILLPLFLRRRP